MPSPARRGIGAAGWARPPDGILVHLLHSPERGQGRGAAAGPAPPPLPLTPPSSPPHRGHPAGGSRLPATASRPLGSKPIGCRSQASAVRLGGRLVAGTVRHGCSPPTSEAALSDWLREEHTPAERLARAARAGRPRANPPLTSTGIGRSGSGRAAPAERAAPTG